MQLFFPLSYPILARSEEKATDDDGGRRRRREEAANSKSCKHSPDAHRRSYSTCSRGSSVTIVHLHPCLWPSVGECGVRMWIRYGWVSPLSTQPSFRVCCPLSTRSTSGKKKERKEGRSAKRRENGTRKKIREEGRFIVIEAIICQQPWRWKTTFETSLLIDPRNFFFPPSLPLFFNRVIRYPGNL